MSDDREARIRERAYQIWIDQDRPEGREHEHWAEAVRQIDAEQQASYNMLQVDAAETIGKPKQGSVIEDHRPLEEPATKTDELPPVHAEKEEAHSGSDISGPGKASTGATGKAKAKPKAKRADEAKKPAAPTKTGTTAAPKARKSKMKSSSVDTL